MYLLGRGKVFIGERSAAGAILALKEFHAPEVEIEVANQYAEHYDSSDAVKVKDLEVVAQADAKARLVIDTLDPKVLAMALGGEVTEDEGTTFTAVAFRSGVAVGDIDAIPGGYANLDTLSIVDSAGTPATLTEGTHYRRDLASGTVEWLNLGAYTQPFKATGETTAEANNVGIATLRQCERFIRFAGINIADNDAPVIVDLYRGSIRPTKVAPKTDGNDFFRFEFEVPLLADPNALFSEAFGKYGRFLKG